GTAWRCWSDAQDWVVQAPYVHHNGAPGGSRTHALRILSPLPLPLGYRRAGALGWTRTNTDRFLKPAPLPLGYQSLGAEGGIRTRTVSWLRRARLPLRHFRERGGAGGIRTHRHRCRCYGVAIRCLTTRPRLRGSRRLAEGDGVEPSTTSVGSV